MGTYENLSCNLPFTALCDVILTIHLLIVFPVLQSQLATTTDLLLWYCLGAFEGCTLRKLCLLTDVDRTTILHH